MFFVKQKTVPSVSMEAAQRELSSDKSILLIDVRTEREYAYGHIPGSVNLPLDRIKDAERLTADKDARIFVYCQSGARSRQAGERLVRMGYTNITNIGGIDRWKGRLERKAGAWLYYPLTAGRYFDETKRIILALQKADNDNVATPAVWRPDDVIVPTADSCGTVKERMENQNDDRYCRDWFMCFRSEKK